MSYLVSCQLTTQLGHPQCFPTWGAQHCCLSELEKPQSWSPQRPSCVQVPCGAYCAGWLWHSAALVLEALLEGACSVYDHDRREKTMSLEKQLLFPERNSRLILIRCPFLFCHYKWAPVCLLVNGEHGPQPCLAQFTGHTLPVDVSHREERVSSRHTDSAQNGVWCGGVWGEGSRLLSCGREGEKRDLMSYCFDWLCFIHYCCWKAFSLIKICSCMSSSRKKASKVVQTFASCLTAEIGK